MKQSLLPTGVSSHRLHLKDQDFNIHYLAAGNQSSSEKIILLVHGWPTSSYLYRHMMAPLSQHHRVIALDLPGFGESDKDSEASFSFRYHAEIIQGLIDQLGIKKVHLVVHDLGGPIGLWWAKQHEEIIESYVLLDTIIYPEFSWAVKLFVGMTLIPGIKSWFSGPSGLKFAMRLGIKNKARLTREVLQAYQAPFQTKSDRTALLRSASKLHIKGFNDIAKLVETTDKPICMIYAENDVILPEISETFANVKKAQPNASLHSVSHCGHFLQEDRPEEVLKPMMAFYQDR